MQQESDWQSGALRRAIRGVVAFGLLVAMLGVAVVVAVEPAQLLSPAFLGMMAAFCAIISLTVIEISYTVRARAFVGLVVFMSWLAMLNFGLAPAPLLVLCLATVAAGVFLGRVALATTLTVTALGILGAGFLVSQGYVTPIELFQTRGMLDWARGSFEYFLASGSLAVVIFVVTLEIERREAYLAKARRLEALGRLAGGIAHDFNNTLQVIYSWTELLSLQGDEASAEGLMQIQDAADRASLLTSQLLAVGRRSIWAPEDINLADHVRKWAASMERILPEDVNLITEIEGAPLVHCDAGQLNQVLMNLVINARDALSGSGEVVLGVEEVRNDSKHPEIETPTLARLTVRDNGTGIPGELVERIFEPFFSTKGKDGTGLGLSIVHSAVRQANGAIDVQSSASGTEFEICLPTKKQGVSSRGQVMTPMGVRRGVVLFAEDETQIRHTLALSLRNAGFTVLAAKDCAEAMKIIDTYEDAIHILVTDAVMPGPPTKLMIQHFKERHPGSPVLMCSGHVEDELESRDLARTDLEFLAKPFAPALLLSRMSELLEKS